MAEKKPVLSISMLVSNGRTDTIKKCMESLVPLRRAVPSELVLVDTGCTDGSIEIAKEYADKVISFVWCNDFSAARNAGLRECSGEWFMYLDDDEWFEDTSEIERFFVSGEYKKYDGAWYIQRNYSDFAGENFTDNYVGRMNPLKKETTFVGKIHEYLFPVPVKMKRFQSFVHHYGYVYKSEDEMQKHFLRNLTLEEAAVAEDPTNIRMCCQLIQEYIAAKRFADAEALCKETMERMPHPDTNPFMQYLFTCLPRIHTKQGSCQKALEEYREMEQSGKLVHMARLLCSYEKLCIYDSLQENQELLQQAEDFLRLWEEGSGGEDYPVMDFATYSSEAIYQRVLESGIKAMLRLNQFREALFFIQRIDWTKKGIPNTAFIRAVLMTYQETGNQRLLQEEAEKISTVAALRKEWMAELEVFLKAYGEDAVEETHEEDLTREVLQRKARNYADAAKTKPIMTPVLRAWMKAGELELLSRQMRELIMAQLKTGNTEEARRFLQEVKKLLPEEEWFREICI